MQALVEGAVISGVSPKQLSAVSHSNTFFKKLLKNLTHGLGLLVDVICPRQHL